MGKLRYRAPSIEVISKERVNEIAPLLMSGGGGGGSVTPQYSYVYVVNSPQFGYGVLGHSGILIRSPSGSVKLYSFHPRDNASPDKEGSIARIVRSGDGASFQAFESACLAPAPDSPASGILVDNGAMRWHEPFRRALELTVPYSKALSMESFALRSVSHPPRYNVVSYNCQSYVNSVLAAGGVVLGMSLGSGNIFSYAGSLVPNEVFDGADAAGTSGVSGLRRIEFPAP